MGDLNCNFLPGARCQGETKKLKSILQSMNMTQVVNEPTRVTRESQTLILIDSVIDLFKHFIIPCPVYLDFAYFSSISEKFQINSH